MKLLLVFLSYVLCSVNGQAYEELPSWVLAPNKPIENVTATEQGSGNLTCCLQNEGEDAYYWSILVNSEVGYGIEVILTALNVSTEDADHLLIASGATIDSTSPTIQLVTGEVTDSLKIFHIPNAESFFLKFYVANGNIEKCFNLSYSQYGDISPTPAPSKDPPPSDENYISVVYLKGKNASAYSNGDFEQEFKSMVKVIAKEYCQDKAIPFEDKRDPNDMVHIYLVLPCPQEWPDYDLCAAIQHSVFVSGNQIPNIRKIQDYELTSAHLDDMWNNYAGDELDNHGLSVYKLPDKSEALLWWIIAVILGVVVLIIGIILFWRFKHVFRRRNSNIEKENPESDKNLRSQSMRMSEFQIYPPFMNSDGTSPVVLRRQLYNKNVSKVSKPSKPSKPSELIRIPSEEIMASPEQFSPTEGNFPAVHFNEAYVDEENPTENNRLNSS